MAKKTVTKKTLTNKPVKKTKAYEPKDKPTAGTAETLQSILGKKIRIKCKNSKQKEFAIMIEEKEIIIAAGAPGTGKSYMSIGKGIELIQNKSNNYDKLLIIKPAVEIEENLGFLPGDLREKLAPYVASAIDIVDKIIGKTNREKMEEAEILVIEALGFIRGKTLDNSIVVIEEAQNISPSQLKSLLTRIGKNSKYIISGDLNQSDKYKYFSQTGLYDIFQRHRDVEEIGFLVFETSDIVRNPLISKILGNYTEHSVYDDAPLMGKKNVGYHDLTKDDDDDILKQDKKVEETPEIEVEGSGGFKDLNEATEHMTPWNKIIFKIKYRLYLYLEYVNMSI